MPSVPKEWLLRLELALIRYRIAAIRKSESDGQKRRRQKDIEATRKRGREYAKQWRLKNPDKDRAIWVRRNEKLKANWFPGKRKHYTPKPPKPYMPRLHRLISHKEKRERSEDVRRRDQERGKRWRENRTPEQRAKDRERANNYVKARVKSDPVFRLMRSFRCRLAIFITRPYRESGMNDLIGCTGQELRTHLEKNFLPGMSWDNYGRYGWHVDHDVPLATFNLHDPEQLKKAWHFTNLKPLWWRDNLIKNKNRTSATRMASPQKACVAKPVALQP